MKKLAALLALGLLTLHCNQNSSIKLGKQSLDLGNNALDIDIPAFFSDEKNFKDESKTDLFVRAEERSIEAEEGKEIFLVYYEIIKNEKKQKLAKFGTLNFENLDLLTDLKDEKAFMISVSEDSLTLPRTNELIKTISEKYGESEKMDQSYNGDQYRWEKDNMVVKLSVRSESERNFDGYTEAEETEESKNSKADQTVKIFILTKDFEKLLKNSYSGMGIFDTYF